jgi:hypothetical protein
VAAHWKREVGDHCAQEELTLQGKEGREIVRSIPALLALGDWKAELGASVAFLTLI